MDKADGQDQGDDKNVFGKTTILLPQTIIILVAFNSIIPVIITTIHHSFLLINSSNTMEHISDLNMCRITLQVTKMPFHKEVNAHAVCSYFSIIKLTITFQEKEQGSVMLCSSAKAR